MAKSVDDFQFKLADPSHDANAPELQDFKKFCLDNGIAPSKAQALLDYQTKLLDTASTNSKQAGEATLRQDWGGNYDANMVRALSALSAYDRQMGGALTAELKATGAANHPETLKFLLWASNNMSEDSLGAGGPGGANPNKPQTAEEAYSEIFK